MMRCLLCLALLVGLLPAAGCDSLGDCNKLEGSVTMSYKLDFTRVEIKKQTHNGTFVAMIVQYVNAPKADSHEIPVKVIAKSPVTEGEAKELGEGDITRVMVDNSQFPPLSSGKITFDELSDPGGHASGTIYITFQSSTVQLGLNGKFCGTVIDASNTP